MFAPIAVDLSSLRQRQTHRPTRHSRASGNAVFARSAKNPYFSSFASRRSDAGFSTGCQLDLHARLLGWASGLPKGTVTAWHAHGDHHGAKPIRCERKAGDALVARRQGRGMPGLRAALRARDGSGVRGLRRTDVQPVRVLPQPTSVLQRLRATGRRMTWPVRFGRACWVWGRTKFA
jgi:hypothetical protein